MAGFAVKAKELGFTHVEAHTSASARMLSELIKAAIPISSILSPCPAVLSSRGVPVSSLYLSSLDTSERAEAVGFTEKTIDLAASVGARAIVLHTGEVPVDLSLRDRCYSSTTRAALRPKSMTRTEKTWFASALLWLIPLLMRREIVSKSLVDMAKKRV